MMISVLGTANMRPSEVTTRVERSVIRSTFPQVPSISTRSPRTKGRSINIRTPEMRLERASLAANPMVRLAIPREVSRAEVLMPAESRAVITPMTNKENLMMVKIKEKVVVSTFDVG